MAGINTLDRDTLTREIARLKERTAKIEQFLNGVPIGTVRIADAAITNAKIANFSFDKGQGGTLKLGGLNNVNGILSLVDDADDEKILLDKDGIIIRDGRLLIENASGSTSIDEMGVVSTNNFVQTASANNSLNQVISGSSETNITGSTLSFTLDRDKAMIILFNASAFMTQSAGNTGNLVVRFVKNNNGGPFEELERLIWASIPTTDASLTTSSSFWASSFAAGNRSFKLTAQLENIVGSPTATIYSFNLTYIILGT